MTALRCLWVARELPFPADSGDRLYTLGMARSLAQAGVEVTMIGHDVPPGTAVPAIERLTFAPVAGGRIGRLRALLSRWPLMTSVQPTAAFRDRLAGLLAEPWDAIVIDQLGSGWALEPCRQTAAGTTARRPLLIHLSHNHETSVWSGMWRESATDPARRLVMYQNYHKVRTLERHLVRNIDLLTTITSLDADLYRAERPDVPVLVMTPGYAGMPAPERAITADRPRRAVIVGSFRWVIKQENLRQFLAVADPLFARHGIGLDVVGDVPEPLAGELRAGLRATTLHGFVDDPAPILAGARLAIVPELIGGGFKLKFLDYLFGRLPVATISAAAAGMPEPVTRQMMMADTLPELAGRIVAAIDDVAALQAMQSRAFAAASHDFDWAVRGRQLAEAIGRHSGGRPATA